MRRHRDSQASDQAELGNIAPSAGYTNAKASLSPVRKEKGRTEIGEKYALINKISRKEAHALFEQSGDPDSVP